MMKNRKRQNGWVILPILSQALFFGGFITLLRRTKRLFNIALTREPKEDLMKIVNLSEEARILMEDEQKNQESVDRWTAQTHQKVYHIKSHDDITLHGVAFVHEQFTHKWAIVVHGYNGRSGQMNFIAKGFYEAGFNVLTPDLRGHGRSGGDYIGMGWHDRLDIKEWVDKIVKGDGDSMILLYGLSMGAAAVLMLSGEELPKNVRCIVEDCGYTSVEEEFAYHIKNSLKLPRFPMMKLLEAMCINRAGYGFSEASALGQIKKCTVPILFIHGAEDSFVPTEMVHRLYEAASVNKEILIVEHAGHGVSANVSHKLYWDKIYSFANKYC